MQKLRDLGAGQLTLLRKRVSATKNLKQREALEKIEAIRRNPTVTAFSALTLSEVLGVVKPKPVKPDDDKPEEKEEDTTLNQRAVTQTCADALLDNREKDLEKNADALADHLREAIEAEDTEDEIRGEIQVEGEARDFSTKLDRKFVGWVHKFCSDTAWGGLIQTTQPNLARALEEYDRPDTFVTDPEKITVDAEGDAIGLARFLSDWDSELARVTGRNPGIADRWKAFGEARKKLLPDLDMLAHFPLEWFAGKSDAADRAEKYLKLAGELFAAVAEHYDKMAGVDEQWARSALHALLALDIVQARVDLGHGKEAFKAVLLPTHPLHLWRYWRLSSVLRGLGPTLRSEDRKAVLEEISQPQQFLSVIFASRFPRERGANRVLPVANDIHRLAAFENLKNACQADDGQQTLIYAIERFAAIHRQHVFPLRIVLINPPHAGRLLIGVLPLLDGRKRDFIPRIRVEIRGTPEHSGRLRQTLPFDTRERDILEEKISGGRLEIRVDREAKSLSDHLAALRQNPCHLLAVFDESTVSIRRGGAGIHLPISPFCARRNPHFMPMAGTIRLEPADTDPPFGEFMKLITKAEGSEGQGNAFAWGEAQHLREAIDSTLAVTDFGAKWFFLADRALPTEGHMRSKRLFRKRDGQRQTFLAASDYSPLVRLIRPVFETDAANLLVPVQQVEALLAEGAHIIGAGILELVKAPDGTIIKEKVIGMMGLLLAARDYRRRHPDSLIVSTDSQLARLWLRLGPQGLGEAGRRCDLMALRKEGGDFVFECVEVKCSITGQAKSSDETIVSAVDQLKIALEAVNDGLSGVQPGGSEATVLTAPRCEMLKEVLVAGAMNRNSTKEQRAAWAEWLTAIFGAEHKTVKTTGLVVGVWLRSSQTLAEEVLTEKPYLIKLRQLGEADVEDLLEDDKGGPADGGNGGPPVSPAPSGPAAGGAPAEKSVAPVVAVSETERSRVGNAQAASGGAILLGQTPTDEPVVWKPDITGNPHLMMVGQPGMGKTTCLVNICSQLAAGGITPIVFSYHDDIDAKLAERFPSVTKSDTQSLGFNPMRVSTDEALGHIENAGLLRDIFSAVFPDLGDLQLEAIRASMKQAYENAGWGNGSTGKKKTPAFRDFLEILNEQPKPDKGTKTLLSRLTELDDYNFFKGASDKQSLLDETNPVVLQVHHTQNENMQRAYAAFTFFRIYQDMFRRGRQERLTHAVIFDEAHKASKLKLIATMAKECRKFGVALILASQESKDFDPSLMSAIANYLILRVTEDSAKHLAKNVVASDRQKSVADKLKQLPKYEAFWLAEGVKAPMRVRLAKGG